MIKRTRWVSRLLGLAVLAALGTGMPTVLAVHPQVWTHQKQADYTDGNFDNTVVTNFGEITLGRELKTLVASPQTDFIQAFAQTPDGTVYYAASPENKVYKFAGGKTVAVYASKNSDVQIYALAADAKGNLLVAQCAETAKLLRLTPNGNGQMTAVPLFENAKVQYIWAIQPQSDGSVLIATGPNGQLWQISPDGKRTLLLELPVKNLLSMAVDPQGNILLGTDGNGLVVRVDRLTRKPFVLLDAGEADVTSLAVGKDGTIYAGTATNTDLGPGHDGLNGDNATEPGGKPGGVDPDNAAPDADMNADQPPAKKSSKPNAAPHKGADLQSHAGTGRGVEVAGGNAGTDLKALLEKLRSNAAEAPDEAGRKKAPHKPEAATERAPSRNQGLKRMGRMMAEEEAPVGNAVHRIFADGRHEVLYRSPDMIFTLALQGEQLLVGTGPNGKLYSLDTAAESQTLLARVKEENIMSLLAAGDGSVYLGTSNTGSVHRLAARTAATGNYVSKVLDARDVTQWGALSLQASTPPGTQATIAVRSGNVADVDRAGTYWSAWSAEMPAKPGLKIAAPAARFLQYRITLTADAAGVVPVVQQVKISYQLDNQAPRIRTLSVGNEGHPDEETFPGLPVEAKDADGTPNHELAIDWSASDPNHDQLTYRVLYRQVGTDVWVQAAKDLKESAYAWNTQAVPDGVYQIKVIASDAADNAPQDAKAVAKVSAPVTIDNTPPVLSELKVEAGEGGRVTVSGTVTDTTSSVSGVRFQIDSEQDWQPAAASDKIFDSPSEAFAIVTRPLGAGPHRIAVRATDSHGNNSFKAVTVVVK